MSAPLRTAMIADATRAVAACKTKMGILYDDAGGFDLWAQHVLAAVTDNTPAIPTGTQPIDAIPPSLRGEVVHLTHRT